MREIKLRAWDRYNKRWQSNLLYRIDGKDATTDTFDLMEFAGLTDSNEDDIYEGDIVYLAGSGNIEMEFPFIDLHEAAMEGDIGVILGNIYENPELLDD